MFRLHVFIAIAMVVSPAFSQLPQVADSRLGVDSVKVDGGKRLYGFLLERRTDQSIVFAVGREWFESTHPQLFEEFSGIERERFEEANKVRIERIEAWKERRPDNRGLIGLLDHEWARFKDMKSEGLSKKKFLVIELLPKRFKEMVSQPPDRRKIAGIAFQNNLEAVTTTPVSQLKKKLIAMDVDIEKESVDLSREVAPQVDSDRQWAARVAVVEHVLRDRIEFQGTGSMLVRKSDKPDMAALVSKMLGGGLGNDPISQLGAELGLPEFKKPKESSNDWWKHATEEAERDGFRGVTITRLNQDIVSATVSVEAYFFAMEKPGDWFQVVKCSGQANPADQTEAQLKRIQEDPQVKSVFDSLKALGLGGQATVEQALRHGAATQAALQDATTQLNLFINQHSRELDSQPIALQP